MSNISRKLAAVVPGGFIIAVLALVLGAASPAQAGTDMCSFYKKNPTDTLGLMKRTAMAEAGGTAGGTRSKKNDPARKETRSE